MNIHLRLFRALLRQIHEDLSRAHPFAGERVGFLTCGVATLTDSGLLLLGEAWHPVADEDYVKDAHVGACIGGGAFRKVFQIACCEPVAVLHVHRHDHLGRPGFSFTDERSMREFVPGFFNACRSRPHGALVLSHNSAVGAIWTEVHGRRHALGTVEVIGRPCERWRLS
ncbi:MAG: hypothetical protein ACJ8R9_30635 [Steroidobacteraceae bacterium]